MYDGGNIISTSACSHITPYSDNMNEVSSNCFGPGGSYKMDLRNSMMVLLSHNTGTSDLTLSISGNLGADNGGAHVASKYDSGSLTGYMTSVCTAGADPSVNHLFVIDRTLSPHAAHNYNAATDSDADGVSGIGPGSPVLYILYSSTSGGCHSDAEHRVIFEAAVTALGRDCGCPGVITDASPIEAAIVNPYNIVWDNNAGGTINDGGGDMYDGGNIISTSACSHITPYSDNMNEVSSNCFGPGGSYKMDLRNSMMVLLSHNTGTSDLTLSISGNLGADNGGAHVASKYDSGSLTGYMTSVCTAGADPSVNHLFVIDRTLSPHAAHNYNAATDSDADGVSGIGPGSPVLYILYSSTSGGCHSDAEHRVIFEAAVASMGPGCGA